MKECRKCKKLGSWVQFPGRRGILLASRCRNGKWDKDGIMQYFHQRTIEQNREPVRSVGASCKEYEER